MKRPANKLEPLARALESAAAVRGVACEREAIPYGLKMTLSLGSLSGIVALYSTGKMVANPRAKENFAEILAALVPAGSAVAKRGSRGGTNTQAVAWPCLGSDESGKGDYFGPLVAAAVLVPDERHAALLVELGVRDSKELSSPREAREIAVGIREVCKGHCGEVVVLPEQYNQRFEALKAAGLNSHSLLAEIHAEAMELACAGVRPAFAMTDKFGNGKEVLRELKKRGLDFALKLETRGERYVAVAAASILARDRCLEWFETAETTACERLPRGAFDPGIIHAARHRFSAGGTVELGRYAKLHFRTTEKVMR